jgi:RNA polymerase sigma-70 factor (ECF subfamily)
MSSRLVLARQKTWPSVSVDESEFMAFAEGRGTHPDLYLAFACIRNDHTALEIFERELLRKVPVFVASVLDDDGFFADVTSAVRDRALCPPVGVDGKIAEYVGNGPLAGWLRVMAVRVGLNLQRRWQRVTDAAPEPGYAIDIERDLLKAKFQPILKASMSRALQGLTARQRTLLRMYIIDGATLEGIARLHDVNRSTVHRWISHATERVLAEARAALGAAAQTENLDSLIGVLRSELGLSLQGL